MININLEDKLGLVKTKSDKESHISINVALCEQCDKKVCINICPAKTYEEINGQLKASFENCLECGSCRIACEKEAIDWQNPRGGFGVTFLNG